MNPIRLGRAVLFLLPYILFFSGILAASKVSGASGGSSSAFGALGIAAVGAIWAWRRDRQGSY
ncbi:hypothetical protein O3S80_05970 [Streptomyces sp. Lzd4kr]|nr:hypothetical protein [Streptomyces sp. Lzd4kr]